VPQRAANRKNLESQAGLGLELDSGLLDDARKLAAFRFDESLELRGGGFARDDALAP